MHAPVPIFHQRDLVFPQLGLLAAVLPAHIALGAAPARPADDGEAAPSGLPHYDESAHVWTHPQTSRSGAGYVESP